MKPILYVEDNVDDVTIARLVFKDRIEREVVVCSDGEMAADLLLNGKVSPAVVLLDLNLPKISGLELLAMIRGDARLERLPVVVLTSSDEPSDKKEAGRLGVSAYLLKSTRLKDYDRVIDALESAAKD